jgi:anti-sigma B factor antagonist
MPQEPLTIEDAAGPKDGQRVLRLNGPLIISNLFDFQSRVRGNTARQLILDFTNVPYTDSAGIGALVGAHVSHDKDGRSLAMVGVCERIRHALQITHVDQFFKFFDSVDSVTA